MRPTAAQLRAARAWLDLSREQAARAAGLCGSTLGAAERGSPSISLSTLHALVAAYALKGIEFVGTSSIERRSPA